MSVLTRAERERLLQAVLFFASRVEALGKVKLFKLLYLFDFEHFRQTGRSATGLDHQAWKLGPVPVELMDDWEELAPDLAAVVRIEPERLYSFQRQSVRPQDGVQFDPDAFTPRQRRILEDLATRYREAMSEKMIDLTHEQNGAWDRVWRGGEGAHRPIPYELALDRDGVDGEALRELAQEQAMYRAALVAARHADPADVS
jgi:uncharacterized phage-associated protein